MNNQELHRIIFDTKPSEKADKRVWWKRLLSSLKLSITPGKTFKQPVKEVMIKGELKF